MNRDSILLEFSNTLVALAAATIFACCAGREPSGERFFLAKRWSVLQAVLFFLVLDLIYKLASPLLRISAGPLPNLAAWLLFQSVGPLWVWLFLRSIGQTVPAPGLSPMVARQGMLHAVQWLMGMVCLVAVAGMVAPPESVAAAFHMDFDDSEGLYAAAVHYFVKLLAAAGLAGLIEEVGYRGILYGTLRARMSPRVAATVTAACFMLAHGEINPLGFGMGLLCAWMVERYRSLLPGIVIHSGWDFASGIHAWFLGALKYNPHGYFQVVALLTGAGFVVLWIAGWMGKKTHEITWQDR